jgi:putative oxidoreductase
VRKFLRSSNDYTLALMRLALGIIFLFHGGQKAMGWFGGNGWNGTMHMFTTGMGFPAFFAACAILAEFVGGILLIIGFLSRLAALAIAINMMVAILKVHLHNGLLGAGPGRPGFELPLALLALCILIIMKGGGALSIDRLFARDTTEAKPAAVAA